MLALFFCQIFEIVFEPLTNIARWLTNVVDISNLGESLTRKMFFKRKRVSLRSCDRRRYSRALILRSLPIHPPAPLFPLLKIGNWTSEERGRERGSKPRQVRHYHTYQDIVSIENYNAASGWTGPRKLWLVRGYYTNHVDLLTCTTQPCSDLANKRETLG